MRRPVCTLAARAIAHARSPRRSLPLWLYLQPLPSYSRASVMAQMLPARAPRGRTPRLTAIPPHAHVPDWLHDSLNRDRSGPHNYWFVLIVFPLGAAAVLCFITVACCMKDCSATSRTAGAVGLVTPTMVTVPAGARPGQTLQLNHPQTGQLVTVVVPQGLVRSAVAGALLRSRHRAVRES